MKNIFATTLFLITYVVSAQIDSFDDFVKNSDKELKEFMDKNDKEFIQFMKTGQGIYKIFLNSTWGNDNYKEESLIDNKLFPKPVKEPIYIPSNDEPKKNNPIKAPLPDKTKERPLPKDDYLDIMPSNIVNKLKEVYKRSNIKDKNINFFWF